MSTKELAFAASTIWVVVAAVLVMFMQAGFAFLEAGLTRMKNVGHIAAKNVLVLGIASVVYYLVGFGIAFGDGGNGLFGGSGFVPSVDDLLAIGATPFSWFSSIPGAAGYLFEVVFCAVSLAIVWGAMAERTRLWVYFAFGAAYTIVYSLVSHWIWSPDGWLFSKGMQDFAGSTVVHYQGALAGLAGALLLGPRIGKFGHDGKPNAIPGHNMAFTTLGVIILWFGWFGFNPGSTLSVDFGGVGFFAYVALNTNLAAAAGVLGAVITSWIVIKKPDLSMMLNGAIAALVAITAACAFVAPWAAIVIGLVAGAIVVLGVLFVERLGIDDPVGAISAHGMAGVWGTLSLGFLTVPKLASNLETGGGGLFYGGGFHQLGVQVLGLVAVGAFTFGVSFGLLYLFKVTVGIRTEPEVETAGLDVSEHGMWGYPEFYIPVPGGYGTEAHGHLGLAHAPTRAAAAAANAMVAEPLPEPSG
jgi:ammonium transporter, Amt family